MKIQVISVLLLFALIVGSCSDSTSPSQTNISFRSGISESSVSASVNPKSDEVQSGITEIKINTVRILLNEIKVKLNSEDKKVRTGPAVYTITPDSQSVEFANADLPSGSIEQIKFEFHRFSSSELATYQNNNTFKDFATADRYSVIITGIKKVGDTETPFEYKSKMTANLTYNITPPLVIDDKSTTYIDFVFQPEFVFKKTGALIDPDDPKNFNDIDNLLKDAIKALKK